MTLSEVDYSNFDYGDEVARWFATEAFRIADTRELIRETGERLVRAGIPLYRLSYFQMALHPDRIGTAYFWRRGKGVHSATASRSMLSAAEYRDNPLPLVFEQGKTIRVRLEGDAQPSFPVLRDLKAEGATDYVALPMVYADGHIDGLSVTSDAPGGFSREHLDRMYALQFLFARIVETHNLRTTAINLLDTYIGHDAGEQVLLGRIARGDGDTIRAVLWFCDLRGFTPLSDRLSRQALIQLLNDYFGCVAAAVSERGGQILKFIGDAMLAIFRIGPADDVSGKCRAALWSARRAHEAMAELNAGRETAGQPAIRFGVALHVGDVMYGNIGAPERLDFTVVGPAVNLVTRIEACCASTGEPLLMSEAFAAQVSDSVVSAGRHVLKGMDEARELFKPREAVAPCR